MTWLPASAEGATPLERVFALRPDLLDQFKDFYFQLWEPRKVDPVLLELCRLRVAQVHGCESELQVRYAGARTEGLSEEKIAALAHWKEEAAFGAAERAALAFAEKFAQGVHCITDEDVAALSAHLAPAEIVALCQALAMFDGLARFRRILAIETEAGIVDPAHARVLY